jgi:hypothetical protein
MTLNDELFRSLWQQRKQEEQEINFRDRQEIKELARCVYWDNISIKGKVAKNSKGHVLATFLWPNKN